MRKKKGKRRNGGRKKGKREREKKGVTRADDIRGGDRGWPATRARYSHAARGEKGGNRVGADRGKAVARGRQTAERCGTGRRRGKREH
jgi:hypothetical protein